VQLSVVFEEFQYTKSSLSKLKHSVKLATSDVPDILNESMSLLSSDVDKLELFQSEISNVFSDVCKKFGEDALKAKPDEFLESVQLFLKNYMKAKRDHQKKMEKENELKRRQVN